MSALLLVKGGLYMASSATVSAPKKRKSFSEYFHSMRGQQLIVTLVFLFVPLVLLFMFTYLPFFKMVEFSFFKMKYIGRRTFVGLQNYISVFTRKDCFHALSLSLYYMVGSVVQMALALLFATILSFKCKGSKFFRGALYFPASSAASRWASSSSSSSPTALCWIPC